MNDGLAKAVMQLREREMLYQGEMRRHPDDRRQILPELRVEPVEQTDQNALAIDVGFHGHFCASVSV